MGQATHPIHPCRPSLIRQMVYIHGLGWIFGPPIYYRAILGWVHDPTQLTHLSCTLEASQRRSPPPPPLPGHPRNRRWPRCRRSHHRGAPLVIPCRQRTNPISVTMKVNPQTPIIFSPAVRENLCIQIDLVHPRIYISLILHLMLVASWMCASKACVVSIAYKVFDRMLVLILLDTWLVLLF
jgi:hypothetical protein